MICHQCGKDHKTFQCQQYGAINALSPGNLFAVLIAFFCAWQKAEGNRGCYSSHDPHDNRCERQMNGARQRGETPVCECYRDVLEKLARQIHLKEG